MNVVSEEGYILRFLTIFRAGRKVAGFLVDTYLHTIRKSLVNGQIQTLIMRATLVTFLAICQTLVCALPSGGKEGLVPVAQRGVVERQPVGSSWTTPSCKNLTSQSVSNFNTDDFPDCTQTTDAGGFASVYSALVGEYAHVKVTPHESPTHLLSDPQSAHSITRPSALK